MPKMEAVEGWVPWEVEPETEISLLEVFFSFLKEVLLGSIVVQEKGKKHHSEISSWKRGAEMCCLWRTWLTTWKLFSQGNSWRRLTVTAPGGISILIMEAACYSIHAESPHCWKRKWEKPKRVPMAFEFIILSMLALVELVYKSQLGSWYISPSSDWVFFTFC